MISTLGERKMMFRRNRVGKQPAGFVRRAGRWIVFALLGFVPTGPSSDAQDLWIFGDVKTNRGYHLAFTSLTSDYHLVSYTDSITNGIWGLTNLMMGAEGELIWDDEEAGAKSAQRYYRIISRPVSQPADSDGDGIDDVFELRHSAILDPLNPDDAGAHDADGDGLSNLQEYTLGTDLEKTDTDGDGLGDYAEVTTHGTDPLKADTDDDGMADPWELANSLNPLADDAGLDEDDDGTVNRDEYIANTTADDPDSFFYVADVSAGTESVDLVHSVSTGRVYTVLFADSLTGRQWDWQTFADTNAPIGTWIETNPAATTHAFVDDFGPATSGSQPTNILRVYTIRVSVPEP